MPISRNADASDQIARFIEWQTSWDSVQAAGNRGRDQPPVDAVGHRRIVSGWIFEPVHVREWKVGKVNADQRARRFVTDSGREMLLHDETGGARREGMLIAAQK